MMDNSDGGVVVEPLGNSNLVSFPQSERRLTLPNSSLPCETNPTRVTTTSTQVSPGNEIIPGISTPNLEGGTQEFIQNQPFFLRPAYRFKPQVTLGDDVGGPGRRMRTNLANVRRHVDYVPTVLSQIQSRMSQRDQRDRPLSQPDLLYTMTGHPASTFKDRPIDCVVSKYLRSAINKVKCPIYDICWTPEGKRLITGSSTGEFTLWNGTAFNFETILQAHDTAIRALKWSHNRQWLLSADHDGFIKYWQDNMNNVHMFQAHKEAVRSISFAPTDTKMVTGSDDGTVRVWDVLRCGEERTCRGHGSDVRSVDWHPAKGLIASGSRDSQQPVKLWDPKTGQCLATMHDHKNSVTAVQWNNNGNWLLTGSRDHLVKLFDIRMMKELRTFRLHKREVTALAWHPVHEDLFVSGGGDGSMAFWLVNNPKEVGLIEHAHDHTIWTLKWHPMGHILASGSNDNNTKFWTRHRPGDVLEDFFPVTGQSAGKSRTVLSVAKEVEKAKEPDEEESSITAAFRDETIPGMGLDEGVLEQMQAARMRGTRKTLLPDNPLPPPRLYVGTNAKRTLIKQPPPKKAQRQMERLWSASTRPIGPSEVADLNTRSNVGGLNDGEPRLKQSLLGNDPTRIDFELAAPHLESSRHVNPPSDEFRNSDTFTDFNRTPNFETVRPLEEEASNSAGQMNFINNPPIDVGPPRFPQAPPVPPPGAPPPPQIMMAAAAGLLIPKPEIIGNTTGFHSELDNRNGIHGMPESSETNHAFSFGHAPRLFPSQDPLPQDCPFPQDRLGPMWQVNEDNRPRPATNKAPQSLFNPNDPRLRRIQMRGPGD